jgi:hypothetical protein
VTDSPHKNKFHAFSNGCFIKLNQEVIGTTLKKRDVQQRGHDAGNSFLKDTDNGPILRTVGIQSREKR